MSIAQRPRCSACRTVSTPTTRAARLVDLIEPIVGADAQLVVAIAVAGERQHAAAEALGLKPEAGRKRYQRALRRLRVSFEDFF